MELSFWESKWRKGNTGFHMEKGYPGLEKYWGTISLDEKPVALVPLCGKSEDLLFLGSHCTKVVGVEISEIAVQEFLTEHNLEAGTSTFAGFTIYHIKNIEIWQGDFFKLPAHKLPRIDLIYDKAALNALPPDLRKSYSEKILELCSDQTKILLHLLEYPQEEMSGPPFSVSLKEAEERFGRQFSIEVLEKKQLDLNNYKNFQNRGLRSYFIEILSLLLPKEG